VSSDENFVGIIGANMSAKGLPGHCARLRMTNVQEKSSPKIICIDKVFDT
jgi:hypothetical protein